MQLHKPEEILSRIPAKIVLAGSGQELLKNRGKG